jgi:hypothetical protein
METWSRKFTAGPPDVNTASNLRSTDSNGVRACGYAVGLGESTNCLGNGVGTCGYPTPLYLSNGDGGAQWYGEDESGRMNRSSHNEWSC